MAHQNGGDEELRQILGRARTIAVVGASTDPDRPSHAIAGFLLWKGYRVFPVNPSHVAETILGQKVYARLEDIEEPIDIVDIFRRKDAIPLVVDEALAIRPKPAVIWMQLGLRDEAAAARAVEAGVKIVMDRCIKIEHARLIG